MLKLVNVEKDAYKDEQIIQVIDLDAALEKKAANSEIDEFLSTLKKEEGYSILHILAMSAGEYYSSNRNGDYFPEATLKKCYKTFETNPAHLFRHHINKDKNKSYGVVIKSVYNNEMHRVELVVKAKNELVHDLNARILQGEYPATSMALKIKSDTCSICGNVAHTRQEYCTHLKNELNRIYPDGRKVFAINEADFSGFDISAVTVPADPISSILQKVAEHRILGSAELAEIEGMTESGLHKAAAFKKLSELIKEINDGCHIVGMSENPRDLLGASAPSDLPLSLIEPLHHFSLSQVFSSLAELGISPSLKFLAELIARKKLGEGYEGIGSVVENFLNEIPHDSIVPVIKFEEKDSHSSTPILVSALAPYAEKHSLFPEYIEKRASNVGYSGNGPYVEPTAREEAYSRTLGSHVNQVGPQEQGSPSYTQLLLGLGGAALLAKYYITTQIEEKLREKRYEAKNNVKINIVKKASDITVTSRLAKIAMVQSLPKMKSKQEYTDSGGVDVDRLGLKITKNMLKDSNIKIGGKLSSLMKIFSFGSKLGNLD